MTRDIVCGAKGCILEPISETNTEKNSIDVVDMEAYNQFKRKRPSSSKTNSLKVQKKTVKRSLKGGAPKQKHVSSQKALKKQAGKRKPVKKQAKISNKKKHKPVQTSKPKLDIKKIKSLIAQLKKIQAPSRKIRK